MPSKKPKTLSLFTKPDPSTLKELEYTQRLLEAPFSETPHTLPTHKVTLTSQLIVISEKENDGYVPKLIRKIDDSLRFKRLIVDEETDSKTPCAIGF